MKGKCTKRKRKRNLQCINPNAAGIDCGSRAHYVGLLSVPDEYQLNFDPNFIKIVIITLLIHSVPEKELLAIHDVSWIWLKKGFCPACT